MKKTTFLLTAVCLVALFLSSQAQVFKNKDLAITKLEKDMWVVETTDMTTMYIIEGTKKAMLIDTGTKCDQLDSIVRLITQKPLYVVLTHAHGDHAGNIRYFKEVYLHPADTVLLDKSYKGKVNFVHDGQVFDLGGKKIEVKHMPAHTPGSIVLIDQKAGNCYSGDAFGSNQVWLQLKPFSPMKIYIESCAKMEKLMDDGIARIYCGHYPYVKKAYDKSYITEMRTLAEALVNGTAPKATPHPQKVSIACEHPMMVTLGGSTIVFDPEHIK
ncbi:MAG TPA: MBL fold metallo-hydrolase [Prolixibacteraceae bacterium]|jgi:glyoxylase-like metal-dependent hydrolase (beta-lactamase superfamily II)